MGTFPSKTLGDKRACLKKENVCVRVFGKQGALQSVTITVSTPSPLSQHLKRCFSLSPAPHHPARVHGCQETSSDTGAHGPERLQTHTHSQIWQREKKAKGQDVHTRNYFATSETATKKNLSNLQQAVADQRHQQIVAVALAHHGGVFRGVHAGEVEHGHVGLAVVVNGKVQRGQLVAGGEVCSLTGV